MNVDNVFIGNMALAHLGSPSVQSFDQPNTASKVLKQVFEAARIEALNATLWNFASMWQVGIRLDLDPKPGWSYVFSYPADALRVFEILRSSVDEIEIPFEVTDRPDGNAGKIIHCNMIAPTFIYSRDKADPATFDMDFIVALSWLIASKIAMPLTKSAKMADRAEQRWMMYSSLASVRTKDEGPRDRDKTASYQAVRG